MYSPSTASAVPDVAVVAWPFSAAEQDSATQAAVEVHQVGWDLWLEWPSWVHGVWQRDRCRNHLCWAVGKKQDLGKSDSNDL